MDALAARIARVPRAHDAERGQEARAKLGVDGQAGDLIAGAAGSSPYLAGLIARNAAWLAEALTRPPEAVFADILREAEAGEGLAAVSAALRRAKARAALLIGLCDLGGVWSMRQSTQALTDLADAACRIAAAAAFAAEKNAPLAGKTPEAAGLIVIAMGKMGAGELNYSSDIDLICLFDESRWPPEDYQEVRARFIRVVQRMVKLLSEVTAEGYVFRSDLRLRPNPSTTAVCLAVEAAERYYESVGRTWERAAYIKARACAGDIAAGEAFLKTLAPFVWRKHLDFAAIEDAHDMRLKIRASHGRGDRLEAAGHNIKLGLGGIREIEFFVQTQQLVRGGRAPGLRSRGTLETLDALAAAAVVDAPTRDELAAAYIAHRDLEHRIQMLEDAQTQTIPVSEEARDRLAALGGWPDRAAMQREVEERCLRVRALCDAFFTHDPRERAPESPEEMAEFGFRRPDAAAALIDRWMAGEITATRGERARRRFRAVAPMFLKRLGDSPDPDEALAHFDQFLSGLPAGVQIFALCEANPHLLDLIAEICASAPRLADYLGRHSSVLDAVLDRRFFDPLPPLDTLQADLAARLDAQPDYESILDEARRWAKERRFRVGLQVLRGKAGATEAGRAFSNLAEAALRGLYPHVVAEFARKHGAPPGRGAAVLAMGKLGSREMTATSDLDLIVICDPQDVESSEGRRPLAAGVYYGRLVQALIAALTAPTAEGALYEVDMRLRPSGSKGPVATRLDSFRRYQREDAWVWEHMALTRARVVGGDAAVAADVETVIADTLAAGHPPPQTLEAVRDMRRRIAEAHAGARSDPWAFKHVAGGLMDIEFALQTGLLTESIAGVRAAPRAAAALVEAGALAGEDADALLRAHALMLGLQQIERVALSRPFAPEHAGPGLLAAMARMAGAERFDAVEPMLRATQAQADAVVTRLLES